MIEKIKKIVISYQHENINFSKSIIAIFFIGLFLRILCFLNYKHSLILNSDDRNYIFGAINYLNHHHLTYGMAWPSEPAMIIMPGMVYMLVLFFKIFGYTQLDFLIIRFILILLYSTSIITIYKIADKIFSPIVGLIAAFFLAIWPAYIYMDNVLLTESPFLVCMLWFIYYTLCFCESKSDKDFLLLLLFYVLSLAFRNTIALIPFLFILYFYQKKFPIKLLLKRGVFAVILLSLLLTPWWIRNYMVTDKFVITTSGSGDPLLGGTYVGDYVETEILSSNHRNPFVIPGEPNSLYNRMQRQEEHAKERIKLWWSIDKESFLKSYLILKPKMAWLNPYPTPIFDLNQQLLNVAHKYILIFAAIGSLLGLITKKYRHGTILCLLLIAYGTIFTIVFLPYPRYLLPFFPFIFMLTGIVLEQVWLVISVVGQHLFKSLRK